MEHVTIVRDVDQAGLREGEVHIVSRCQAAVWYAHGWAVPCGRKIEKAMAPQAPNAMAPRPVSGRMMSCVSLW
jgi:hypothetical protein